MTMPADSSIAVPGPSANERATILPRASLRRRLLRGTFWSTAGRIASMGTLLLGNVVLAWAWKDTRGDFAAYAVAAAAVMLLGFPATMGAPKILTRVIREGIHTGQPARLRAQLRSATWLMLISCAVVTVLTIFGVRLLEEIGVLSNSDKWRALTSHSLLVAAWMCLSALCMAVSQALMGFDDFRSAALVGARNGGVIANTGFLAVALVFLATGNLTLAGALWAQSGLNLLALIAGIYWLRAAIAEQCPQNDAPEGSTPPADAVDVRWFFQESWPNLVIQLTSLGILPVELLLVSSMTSEGEIADYTAVQRLQEVLVAAQTLATTIAAPFIAELYARREFAKLEMVLRGAATLVAVPALAFLSLYILIPRQTLAYSFGPDFVGGAWPLRIASVGAVIGCLAGANNLTMIMVGRQRELLRASIVASIAYFVAAPVLIYYFRTVGAALAVAAVFGSYNVVVTLMVKNRVGVWTTASLSPKAFRAALRKLTEKRQ